jgi:uncharacterized protein (UPF0264 family)
MRLLVSVRSADEVPTALAGGADIIDAKEPARGSLGAVAPGVLSAIDVATPRLVPLSVALGDWTGPREVRAAMDAARTGERSAPVYLKLGFAGVPSLERLAPSLAGAVQAAGPRRLVAVGYGDDVAAGAPPAEEVLRAAIAARTHGFLLDTWHKDGRSLLDHVSTDRLAQLSTAARSAGLLFALAGSLDADAVSRVAALADILGFRGAACGGGRSGTVDRRRVAALRRGMASGG